MSNANNVNFRGVKYRKLANLNGVGTVYYNISKAGKISGIVKNSIGSFTYNLGMFGFKQLPTRINPYPNISNISNYNKIKNAIRKKINTNGKNVLILV